VEDSFFGNFDEEASLTASSFVYLIVVCQTQ
jgi:hypothetical protein